MPIVLKDFHKQDIISLEDVSGLIESIPSHHLKGLKYVVYDPVRFYQRSYVQPSIPNRHIKGQYFSEMLDAVIIYEIEDKELFEHILFHEVGHYVFQRILSPEQKKHWVTNLYPSRVFVSNYAKTNAQEDFAESYAFYLRKQPFSFVLRAKYNFLSKIF